MAIEKQEDFVSPKSGETYQIYRARGPFRDEAPELYEGLYELSEFWGIHQGEIEWRFGDLATGTNNRLGTACDLAYLAVKSSQVVADVLIMSDEKVPVGLYCDIHTQKDFRKQGICSKLLQVSSTDWFENLRGELLILHTEYQTAYDIYHGRNFSNLLGIPPRTDTGNDVGMIMLRQKTFDCRDLPSIVHEYYDGKGELLVENLQRCDAAQFLLLCAAERSQQKKIPALGIDTGLNAEARLIEQFLYGMDDDTVLALKADNKLVGIAAQTDYNETLHRAGLQISFYVHQNYKEGEVLLRKELLSG